MRNSSKAFPFNRVLRAVLGGAFLAAAIPMTAAAAIADFSGHWVSADPAKASIEFVTVWSNEEGLQVQVSGCFASTPALLSEQSACSWGAARVQVFSGSMNANPDSDARIITASFNAGFGQRQLVLHRMDGGRWGLKCLLASRMARAAPISWYRGSLHALTRPWYPTFPGSPLFVPRGRTGNCID